jgi:flavin-dependent dehydrogenase
MDALRVARLGDLPKTLGGVPLHTLLLQTSDKQIPMPLQDSVSVSRFAFDAALVEHAKQLGVCVLEDTSATVLKVNQFDVTVDLVRSDQHIEHHTKIVVAADGIGGTSLKNIASLEPAVQPHSKVGTGGVSHDVDCRVEPGNIYMHYASGGYVGMVRLEDGSIDIAAALDAEYLRRSHSAALAVKSILERSGALMPRDLQDIQWRGTVPLTRQRKAVAAERIFVVGDSAAYVEPFTGEGISWALNSALLVAPLVERGTRIWNPILATRWNELFQSNIRTRQNQTSVIAWLLKQESLAHFGATMLEAFPPLREPLVQAIARPRRSK